MESNTPDKPSQPMAEKQPPTGDEHIASFMADAAPEAKSSRRRFTVITSAALILLVAIGLFFTLTQRTTDSDPTSTDPTPVDPTPPDPVGRPAVAVPSDREYADAIDERVHNELAAYAQWLRDNKVYGIVGEFGWPRDTEEGGEQWRTIAENWLLDLAQTNILSYYWATGGAWGGYTLSVHNSENRIIVSNNSQSFQLNAYSKDNALGINMAGLEFGTQLPDYSNENPGSVENDNYIFNAKENYDYIASEGYSAVRIPFTWERLQQTLKGPLDPTYLGYIKSSVEFAEANDLSVVLDLHNYGEYKTAQGILRLGSPELSHEDLVDVWIKLSDAFKDSTADISYGIMNEPRSMQAEQWATPAENWEAASQLVVDALRQHGDEREIIIGGYNWSKLSTWAQYHADAWITDPANNTIYEAHHYWDSDTSGTYVNGYR